MGTGCALLPRFVFVASRLTRTRLLARTRMIPDRVRMTITASPAPLPVRHHPWRTALAMHLMYGLSRCRRRRAGLRYTALCMPTSGRLFEAAAIGLLKVSPATREKTSPASRSGDVFSSCLRRTPCARRSRRRAEESAAVHSWRPAISSFSDEVVSSRTLARGKGRQAQRLALPPRLDIDDPLRTVTPAAS